MIKLGIAVSFPEFIKVNVVLGTEVLETRHVADWRIYPDIEEFIRCTGNFKTKIGRVATDIPLLQPFGKPLV